LSLLDVIFIWPSCADFGDLESNICPSNLHLIPREAMPPPRVHFHIPIETWKLDALFKTATAIGMLGMGFGKHRAHCWLFHETLLLTSIVDEK
jgi:hypothetical protein